MILFIIAALGVLEGVFLDVGSGNGVNSNCANLALNFGWRGTFIDGNESNITQGRAFYEHHSDTWAYPAGDQSHQDRPGDLRLIITSRLRSTRLARIAREAYRDFGKGMVRSPVQ
jgi:hypothetical protein